MPSHFFTTLYSAQHSSVVYFKTTLFPRALAQMLEPLSLVMSLLNAIYWIAGAAFIFGALGRYVQYRSNPSQAPISQTFFLAILGIVLLLMPTIGRYALFHRSLFT